MEPETRRSLDEETVKELYQQGGKMLGTSRGGNDTKTIVDSLVEQKVNLRGAANIADEIKNVNGLFLQQLFQKPLTMKPR